ncbi:MAG TPA: hypothetical protein VGF76_19180 [Polyangiaceae bacterium]
MVEGHRVELELQLPEAVEQDRLLAGLARLIALRGHEHFLQCPIVLPVAASFSPSTTRDLGSFRRASAIFERRFEEWAAAKGGTPTHTGL